jgi:hypothetical protein
MAEGQNVGMATGRAEGPVKQVPSRGIIGLRFKSIRDEETILPELSIVFVDGNGDASHSIHVLVVEGCQISIDTNGEIDRNAGAMCLKNMHHVLRVRKKRVINSR